MKKGASVEWQQLAIVIPLALYATFFWRTTYSYLHLPLRVLDWVVPALGLGAWIALRLWQGKAWPHTRLDWPLLIWGAATIWSMVFSVNRRGSLRGMWETGIGMLLLWLLVDAIRSGWGSRLWRTLYLLGGAICLIEGVELLSWYFGWSWMPLFQQGWFPIGGWSDPVPPTLHRLSLALIHSTVLAAFLALLIPPGICVVLAAERRDVRVGMALWLLAAGGTLFLSLSRGGFVALAVSLPVVLAGVTRTDQVQNWWHGLARFRSRILLGGATVLALAAILVGGFTVAWRLGKHQSGDAVRLDLWHSALLMLRDRPLTGVGPYVYGTALRVYRDPLFAREQLNTAHSLYLNVGAEMGIPGLLAGAWLIYALICVWWRRWRYEKPGTPSWWRLLGCGAGLVGWAAHSLIDAPVDSTILLPVTLFSAQILSDKGPQRATPVRSRWLWVLALLALTLGTSGMAWDDTGYTHFTQSLSYLDRGKAQEAVRTAERARQHDPGMPLYSCHTGYLYGLQAEGGDRQALELAIERYQGCLATQVTPGWVDQVNMAALQWSLGQNAQAHKVMTKAATQMPLEPVIWLNQGLMAEDSEQAVHAFGRVLALAPDWAGSPFWQPPERAALWERILAEGERARYQDGEAKPYWRWQVGVAAGQWKAVAQETGDWLTVHSDDGEATIWHSAALIGLGDAPAALAWLERLSEQMPADARRHILQGEAYLALGQHEQAERHLRTALVLEPGNHRAHLGLARLARLAGDTEGAMLEYGRSLTQPSVTHGYDLVLYQRTGWPALLPQVARIGSGLDGEVALEWGQLLEQQGDLDTARQVYATALFLDPFLQRVEERLQAIE